MRLNKREKEYSNRMAVLFGFLSIGLFWLAMFTTYHLYLWARAVGYRMLLVSLLVFVFYFLSYRWNFRTQMSTTKAFYSKEKRRKKESA